MSENKKRNIDNALVLCTSYQEQGMPFFMAFSDQDETTCFLSKEETHGQIIANHKKMIELLRKNDFIRALQDTSPKQRTLRLSRLLKIISNGEELMKECIDEIKFHLSLEQIKKQIEEEGKVDYSLMNRIKGKS